MQTGEAPLRTPQSDYLLDLGSRILQPYARLPTARAAMITGSAAEGIADFHSDLDTTVYYADQLPSEEALASIRAGHGAPDRAWLLGDRTEGGIAEAWELDGIQIQIGHVTIAAWERDIAEVLESSNPDTPLQKAMSGTLESVTVAGDELMRRWKTRISDYPEGLRRAMVTSHLRFFPLWSMPHICTDRDAVLWQQQVLVEGAFNLLAVLAGLNRRYFSTFQFKKMRRFLEPMEMVPGRCADRLESLFRQPPVDASETMEGLVSDVVDLVERVFPDIDTAGVRQRLGYRRPAWTFGLRA